MGSSVRRLMAAMVAVVLVGGGLAAWPAGAAIGTQEFCANVTPGSSGFGDLGNVSASARADIECLAASAITSGTSAGVYSPFGTVFRDSMATFVARLVDTANALELSSLASLPGDATDAFGDDNGTTHESNIDRLAAAGIINGKAPGVYGPNGPGNEVTRGQMATFLVAAIDFLRGTDLPAAPDAFGDDNGTTHEANINKLAAIDVVDGTGPGVYNYAGTLSRAQMAAFLVRTLAYLEAEGDISPLGETSRTIALNPSGPVTNEIDSAAGGEVAFTATQIQSADVDIALFPCESVTAAAGSLAFADTTPDDDVADRDGGEVDADIVAVNTNAQGADTESVSGAAVANGTVTFTVDSPVIDCVVAVVWDDADDDDALDVAANGTPTEDFGASGRIDFAPPAAASGPMDEDVDANDEAGNRFIGCELGLAPGAGVLLPEADANAPSTTDCATFAYDSTDLFFVDANANLSGDSGESVSLAAFETALSPGDDVSGTYNATAASQSTFVLTDEAPTAPGGVAAAPIDGDTIRVTFDEVPGADQYRVYTNATTGVLPCPAFATTGDDPYVLGATVPGGDADADSGTTNTADVNGLTDATRYCVVVTSVETGDESGGSTAAEATTSNDNTAPTALDTELAVQASQPRADGGDVIQICLDQDIADPETDELPLGDVETLDLEDGDGTVVRLTDGANADFRRGTAALAPIEVGATGSPTCAASRVLEVTITAEVTIITAGSTANLQYPADIVAAGNVEDTAGTQFQPEGDPDVRVDEEAAAEPA